MKVTDQQYQLSERDFAWRDSRISMLDAPSQTYKIALQSSGDALISTDTHGNILQMNRTAEAMTGWLQAEALDLPLAKVFRIINDHMGEVVDSLVESLLHERTLVDWTNFTLLIAKNGTERPIASCGAPIRNSDGEITGVVLIFRDQTAQYATTKSITDSEARYRDAFERSPVATAFTRPDGRTFKVNRAFADLLGISIEELQKTTLADIIHPLDYANTLETNQCLLNNERSTYRIETRYQHRNGHLVFADVSTTLLRDSEGEPLYFVTSSVDITQRKQKERELVTSEARYRRLFEASKDGILIVDADDGKIADVNPFLIELTGYSRRDFLGNVFGRSLYSKMPPC